MKLRIFFILTFLVVFPYIGESHKDNHQSFFVSDFKIINYSDFIPKNPVFVIDLSYEMKENHEENHNHTIKLIVNIGNKKDEFIIGENTIFKKISPNTITLFLPIFQNISVGKKQNISFSFLEGKTIIFTTNITFFVSNLSQDPIIFYEGLDKIEISKNNPKPNQFFFVSQYSYEGEIINLNNKTTNKVKSQKVSRIKGLNLIDYTFSEEGEYIIKVGNSSLQTKVSFDKTPPFFKVLTPSNNSIFYRTNNIQIKWTDPVDNSGINIQKSVLSLKKDGKTITNISPLVSLNKESSINPYETVFLSLPEGDYECDISYSDYDGNSTNTVINFKILNPNMDKVKPFLKKIFIENSEKVSENEFRLKSNDIRMFLEFSDGEYGSGVKTLYYSVDGEIHNERVFDNIKYLFFDVNKEIVEVKLWVEDFAGNSSDTNVILIKR